MQDKAVHKMTFPEVFSPWKQKIQKKVERSEIAENPQVALHVNGVPRPKNKGRDHEKHANKHETMLDTAVNLAGLSLTRPELKRVCFHV